MNNINIPSDQYFQNKKRYDDLEDVMGIEVCPVDLNGAYVAEKESKFGVESTASDNNGGYIQDNIRQRFGLTSPDFVDPNNQQGINLFNTKIEG